MFVGLNDTLSKVQNGQSFNSTKFYNDISLSLAFPTATGLPFSYTLKVPTLVQAGGEVQARVQGHNSNNNNNLFRIPEAVNVTAEIEIV